MLRLELLVLVAALAFFLAPVPWESSGERAAAAEDAPVGLMAVTRPGAADVYSCFPVCGWVTAVDGRSITIRRLHFPGEPPVKYPACEELIAGEVLDKCVSVDPRYPLRDVKVGDFVEACSGLHNGVQTCFEISILRRPGGRLGPRSVQPRSKSSDSYMLEFKLRVPYHELVNAIQDYEERGIPVPPHMRPAGRRPVPGIPLTYLNPDGTIQPTDAARKLADKIAEAQRQAASK
jgi:hypothetical protein